MQAFNPSPSPQSPAPSPQRSPIRRPRYVLSRRAKRHEQIVIELPEGPVTVTVLRVRGDVVSLGIDAPASLPIAREEVRDRGSAA